MDNLNLAFQVSSFGATSKPPFLPSFSQSISSIKPIQSSTHSIQKSSDIKPQFLRRRRTSAPISCLQSPTPATYVNDENVDVTNVKNKSKWSDLTVQEFNKKLKSGNLPICFVGMSNCGKSHWSWQLHEQLGFNLLGVDDKIESILIDTLRADGHVGIEGLAAWMGFPTDERFVPNQATYLAAEEKITSNASPVRGKNSVLDTTGSVIYLSQRTRQRICNKYLVIHLEAGDELLNIMTENYFKTPKPVVWGDSFNRKEDETPDEALRRCYPNLLRERRERYALMAHVTIPASVSLDRSLDVNKFLDEVRNRLNS